ncbi:FAD-dependent oxidoreductase [Reyranella sp. CPCC 100927]|uniref:FAD-dependent oxidoreductase n=1 Tax=Reyranella sp. CPCC 100927 TaxID=2599616 RepID=UPI0011B4D999|nr:FAD-dependent oxidoreductase [Reyranella sp. CPCC 100927]TWT15833.1 FAD-dependent oxidoreductase [Reyranella sp. CPCC 100927]
MDERIECDVLIAGSGAAGFATAITAAHHGLDVIMVEKEPLFGGTTAFSAGVIWIPCNEHARKLGIADSRAEALTYLEHEIGNRLDRAKAEAFIDHGAAMLAFFERHSHVRYLLQTTWADYHPDQPGGSQGGRSLLPEPFDGTVLGDMFLKLRPPIATMMILGGMMVGRDDIPHLFNLTRSVRSVAHVGGIVAKYALQRLRWPRGTRVANGNALVARLAKTAFEQQIPLWLESPVVKLHDVDGAITGARVRRNGREVDVVARRGVVLACGGFPASDELRRRTYPHLAAGKNHERLAPAGNAGDGIRLAQQVGAAFVDDPHHPAAWTPVSLVPQSDGGTVPFPHFIDRGKPGYIAVDRRGRRFANEAKSYHDFVPAMIEACRDDPVVECFLLCDHAGIRRYGLGAVGPAPARLGPHVRSGYITRADSIDALAQRLGVDARGLVDTVATFNQHAAKGEDPEFGKGGDAYQRFNGAAGHAPNPCIAPIATPPYYAVRLVPGDIGTFAGLRTDPLTRVLDATGRPITGLHAVGNDMASVMGGTYPGAGITIGPAMTFGYIAGRHLAGVAD